MAVVLSSGTLAWDTVKGQFDRDLSNALPVDLLDRFIGEPLWLDVTWLDDNASQATMSEPRFLDVVATLSATLQGRPKDEIAGDDVRQLSLRRRLAGGALVLISIGFVAAVVFAINFLEQRNEAQLQRAEAIRQRDAALLTQSRFLTDLTNQEVDKGNASLGILLALEALPKNWPSWERPYYPPAMTALYGAAAVEREVLTIGPSGKIGTATVSAAELNRDGSQLLVGTRDGSVELWDTTERKRLAVWPVASKPISGVAFGNVGHAFAAAGPAVYQVDTASGDVKQLITLPLPNHEENTTYGGDFGLPEVTIDELWVSNDGTRFVVIDEMAAQLWTADARGLTPHAAVPLHSGLFYHYSLDRDGRLIATGDAQSGEIVVSELDTGSAIQINLSDYHQDGGSFSATFDRAGRRLLIGGGKAALLIDLKTRRQLATLSDHVGSVIRADFSPDGSMIATGSEDGSVKLWTQADHYTRPVWTATGFVRGSVAVLDEGPPIAQQQLLAQRLHNDFEPNVDHLTFDASGKHVLATSGDRTIFVFDVESNLAVTKVRGHDDRIDKVALSADGAMALTIGRDGTARLWRTTPADLPMLYPGYGSVSSVKMPAGRMHPIALVTYQPDRCGAYARAWRIDTGEAIGPALVDNGGEEMNVGSISADGSTLVAGAINDELRVIDLASGRSRQIHAPAELGAIDCVIPGPGGHEVLFTSESGERIVALPEAKSASAVGSMVAASGALASGGNLWWALASNGGNKTLSALQDDLNLAFVEINRDGNRILVRRSDDNVALYDATTATEIRVFVRPKGEEGTSVDAALLKAPDADDVSFSDDGLSVIGAIGRMVRVWSASDGRLLRTVTMAATDASSVALAGPIDHQRLAVAGADGSVRLFDTRDDDRGTLLGEGFSEPARVVVSADGRRAVVEALERSCGFVPELWDLVESRRITSLPVSGTCSYSFKFSRDASEVIGTVTEPDGIALWESEGGSELARYRSCLPAGIEMYDAEPTNVMTNGFSDDLTYVYAGTLGGAVCVWQNPGAGSSLISFANKIVPRGLTQEERAKYPVP